MSKLKKFLSKPRISRLVSFSVVLILIAGSAYFAYKRGVFADTSTPACSYKLTDLTPGTNYNTVYITEQKYTDKIVANPSSLEFRYITKLTSEGSSYGSALKNLTVVIHSVGVGSKVTPKYERVNCTKSGVYEIAANLMTGSLDVRFYEAQPYDTETSTAPDSSGECVSPQIKAKRTDVNPNTDVCITCNAARTSQAYYHVEDLESKCPSGNPPSGSPGSPGSEAPVVPKTGCPTGEKCYTSAADPGGNPVCLNPSDTGAVDVGMYTEVNINQCTYQAAGNPASDPAVSCEKETDCSRLGAGFTCVENVCIKTGGDATIAGGARQGTGQIDPKVPVAALGRKAAPAGIGKVIFSAWRASQSSDSGYVPVGGVGLNISGEIQQTPGEVKLGNVQETDAKGFANNQACNTWDTIRRSVRGLLGGTVSYRTITPDNGLTKNATQVLNMPVGFYRITIDKNHFSLPNNTSLERNNSICFSVTKDQTTNVKVQLLAKNGAEPPGINGDVLYEKTTGNKGRFLTAGEYMYKPEAPYYGWQKISGNADKDWGYNSTPPLGVDGSGNLVPGITPNLGIPGGSMGNFLNLCQGLSLTIGGVKIDKTTAMIGGAFINSLQSIIKGAKGKTIAGKLLEGAGIGWIASELLGNGTDITVNLGSLNQQCAAFNQLGIPPQCNGCFTGGYCPPGCLANSAFTQSAFQLQNLFR